MTVPQLPPHHVSRPRLLAELDRAAALPLTLLSAGPGAGKTVLLTARSDPLLPLHRYRLAGQMYELRVSDLALTRAETAEVLAVHGVTLPARDFDLLVARTEGWVAGVQLSAMRMEATGSPSDF